MPSELRTSKIIFLISSVINIIYGGFSLFGSVIFGVLTCGCGCLSIIIPALCIVTAVLDFISFDKLNNLDLKGTYSSIQTAATLEIINILTGNLIVFIFGIINLVNIQRKDVKDFLINKNIY